MGNVDTELVKTAIQKHLADAIALSDDLAAHPELSYEEFESSKKMVALLRKSGYEVTYPYLGYDTAFCGVIDNGDGPSVAILAEYDALPGIGHACGHNLHGSLSILTALAMLELKDQFKGKVYIIGTPAEEENGAKVGMADKGVFDKMSLAVMMHSWSGEVSIPNMDVLSLRCYVVEFHGQSAHAVAGPWEGRSALAAARKFLDLIDARRECFTPDMRVNSVILDGGKAPNIIPDYTKIRMEFRTDSLAKLEKVDEMIRKCANGAAMAMDCTVTLESGASDFADMVRVKPLEQEISVILDSLGKKTGETLLPSGSSDMGNVSYCCPSIQPLLSIADHFMALHTVEMAKATTQPTAHEAMARGAEALAILSLKVLNDDNFRQEVYDAFVSQRDSKLKN
ncbi:MAG: amidohydrolase [Clostridium sp.]